MVKLVVFFKRRAGMEVEPFQEYWRARHAEVARRLPGVRRYVQSHTLPAGYRKGEPVYDGIAELWFDDTTRSGPSTAPPRFGRRARTRRGSSTVPRCGPW